MTKHALTSAGRSSGSTLLTHWGISMRKPIVFCPAEGRHVPSEMRAELQACVPHHEARKCCVLTKPNVGRSKSGKL